MNKQQHKWMNLPVLIVFAVFYSAAAATGATAQAQPDATIKARLAENYGKLPMSFEANRGQTDKQVQFISQGLGYALFITPTDSGTERSIL